MRDATLIARDFANRRKSAVVRIYGGIDSMGQSDAQQRVAAVLQKNPELSDRIIATDVSRSQTNNVSGTEMRHYASSGDAKSFMKNLPAWLSKNEKTKIWQQFQP
jgi:hypothetical protein